MKQLVFKYGKYFISFLILAFIVSSCDKVNESPVPEVYVSFSVNLSIANELVNPNGSQFFPGHGFGGVIVYCESPGTWYAYDAACTYEASRNCIVENDGALAVCPCCESQFILLGGGSPASPPASVPLKQYNVSIMNNNSIYIYN